jgi:hypothetical protein
MLILVVQAHLQRGLWKPLDNHGDPNVTRELMHSP